MSYCIKCGKELPDEAEFCSSCGAKQSSSNTENEKRKIVYDGEIIKCPKCGEDVRSFESKCSSCGWEKTTISVKQFATKLENISSEEKRIKLIKDFYIPNTKGDINEFFIYAISNLSAGGKESEVWQIKLEQTYHKAKLTFGDSPEFEYIQKLYSKTLKDNKKNKLKEVLSQKWKLILGFVMGFLAISMLVVGFFAGSKSNNPDSPFYIIAIAGIIVGMLSFYIIIEEFKKKKEK